MRIDWEVFFGNSSTESAICLFASRRSTFKQFNDNSYPQECKAVIKYLKHIGYKKAIKLAQRALSLRGFKDYKNDFCDCNSGKRISI